MGELSAFDEMMLSVRPVFDFMLALWSAIPAEVRFVFALFFGIPKNNKHSHTRTPYRMKVRRAA